jgi:uncharacterized membrane protein YeaQ/YmgE (transglycosylase-associated protein family)
MLVNVVLWIVFGLIAGAVAQFLMPGKDPGQSGNLRGFAITTLLGIAGAMLGGWLSSQFFSWDVTGFNLPSFIIAIAGALLLLVVYRLLMSSKRSV